MSDQIRPSGTIQLGLGLVESQQPMAAPDDIDEQIRVTCSNYHVGPLEAQKGSHFLIDPLALLTEAAEAQIARLHAELAPGGVAPGLSAGGKVLIWVRSCAVTKAISFSIISPQL